MSNYLFELLDAPEINTGISPVGDQGSWAQFPSHTLADRALLPVPFRPAHSQTKESDFSELYRVLFASLPRSDQRRKGIKYIEGLLATKGRKSIRKIATSVDGQVNEQSLHHFISDSTWDWVPVRQALAHFLRRVITPQAWVIRPIAIPKTGVHSVGVRRTFVPERGQILNAQHAVGVWHASERLSFPVSWRLHLGQSWLNNPSRRIRAGIPAGMSTESPGDCAVESFLELDMDSQLPRVPVVMDARETDIGRLLRRLRAIRMPFLVRINGTALVSPTHMPLAGYGDDVLPAYHLMTAARDLRRPIAWRPHIDDVDLVAAVRVRLTSDARQVGRAGPRTRDAELLLLGSGPQGRCWPDELWVTNLVCLPPPQMFRLGRLVEQVDRDFAAFTDHVGIRDYTGRTYGGWHRHATLASAAHAIAALG